MYRTVAAVLISMLFAAPALAQSACEALALSKDGKPLAGCGTDCICDEVEEGFI